MISRGNGSRQCRPGHLGGLLATAALAAASLPAAGGDVFNTRADVPAGPADPVLHDAAVQCTQSAVGSPLSLLEAIERSLCRSPKAQIAWASVKAAAAAVGESKSAYLPNLDGSVSYSAEHNDVRVTQQPSLQSNFSQPVNSESLSLTWLLYDFGGRAAALRGSKELLTVAQANENLMLQTVLSSTAKDYYAAQATDAALQSAHRIESYALQTLDAATERYKTGVAPVTDQLQANTIYQQAVVQRARAEGAQQIALGTLAVDMSLPADQRLLLPQMDQSVPPDTAFVHAVHELIDEAIQSHPSVVAARAQWQAALEDVRAARAAGLPKLSLSGSVTRSDQPQSASLGQPVFPAVTRDESIGLNLEFPLFEGFSTTYKIRQAEAVADSGAQALRDAQQQIEVGVWSSFSTLQADTDNLHNTQLVAESASDAFAAAEHRYASGVGSILEVLSAQTQLAAAEQQYIQAQFDWRTARILLAQSLGRLGLWAVQ